MGEFINLISFLWKKKKSLFFGVTLRSMGFLEYFRTRLTGFRN